MFLYVFSGPGGGFGGPGGGFRTGKSSGKPLLLPVLKKPPPGPPKPPPGPLKTYKNIQKCTNVYIYIYIYIYFFFTLSYFGHNSEVHHPFWLKI